MPFYALLALVGFALLTAAMLLGASVGRWLVVRALGVRGVRFPFGAGTRWSWTTTSVVPQALALLGAMAGMYAAPALCTSAGLWIDGEESPDELSMRIVVEPDGPADAAGLRDGDRVDAVNGERVTTWDALRSAIARHPREAVQLSVTRDAHPLNLAVTPDGRGLIRVRTPTLHRAVGLGEGLRVGTLAPARFLYDTARSLVGNLAGTRHEEMSGPAAIVRETGNQSKHGSVLVFFGMLGGYMLPFLAVAALFLAPGRRKKR